eukprot:15361931-Ditylum_brightwellii.AAC.1
MIDWDERRHLIQLQKSFIIIDIGMSQEEKESNEGEENSNNIVEFDLEHVQWDQGEGNSDNADEIIEVKDNSNESGKGSEDKSDAV